MNLSILARAGLAAVVWAAPAGAAVKFTIIHSFTGELNGGDGESPQQAPIVDAAGAIYGATPAGGQFERGAIYKFVPPATKNGSWSGGVIYSFNSSGVGGQYPECRLLMGADGTLYGTTYGGGANGQGSAFALVQGGGGWVESTLFDFSASGGVGWLPEAGLVMDGAGALYGTTDSGGSGGQGVVFKLVNGGGTRWAETVLHHFVGGGADGVQPSFGPLVMDAKGDLYGTTQSGGTNGGGVAYRLAPPKAGKTAWTETILHGFGADGDGAVLEGGLTLGKGGVLYGATDGGGAPGGQGTVFSLTPAKGQAAWPETILFTFTQGGPFGSYPRAGVALDKKGDLLGLTNTGGADTLGTAFELSPAGGAYTPADLFDFTSAANKVFGTLSAGPAGVYYGVTYDSSGGYGAVFSIKP